MMGIYFNLSFWYKLIDKTIWGAWFSLAGCAVLLVINFVFIPHYGYMACAWGGFAGYGTSMILSYLVGQKKNPINYPMRSIMTYIALALLLTLVMIYIPESWNIWARLGAKTILVILFAAYIVKKEKPSGNRKIFQITYKPAYHGETSDENNQTTGQQSFLCW